MKVQLTLITCVFPLFVFLVFMKCNFLFTTKLVLVTLCIIYFNLSDFYGRPKHSSSLAGQPSLALPGGRRFRSWRFRSFWSWSWMLRSRRSRSGRSVVGCLVAWCPGPGGPKAGGPKTGDAWAGGPMGKCFGTGGHILYEDRFLTPNE